MMPSDQNLNLSSKAMIQKALAFDVIIHAIFCYPKKKLRLKLEAYRSKNVTFLSPGLS
jgi:hypothetical protein